MKTVIATLTMAGILFAGTVRKPPTDGNITEGHPPIKLKARKWYRPWHRKSKWLDARPYGKLTQAR